MKSDHRHSPNVPASRVRRRSLPARSRQRLLQYLDVTPLGMKEAAHAGHSSVDTDGAGGASTSIAMAWQAALHVSY
jgi:hypothetical protein